MEAIAKLKFARISTRKARVVLNIVRGQFVAEALDQLRFTRKAAAPMVPGPRPRSSSPRS